MAKAPVVSWGWSTPFVTGAKAEIDAAGAAVKAAAAKADALSMWTSYTNVLGINLPDALRNARLVAAGLHRKVK